MPDKDIKLIRRVEQDTANRIADFIVIDPYYSPISESRAIPCEHGYYGLDDCLMCAVMQLAEDIRAGEWRGK